MEDNFLTLSNGIHFPLCVGKAPIPLPSTLLVRQFHRDMMQIIESDEIRVNGYVFFGPPGIGKSWSSMYMLWALLKQNVQRQIPEETKSIVYFDAMNKSAWIFGESRTCKIRDIDAPHADNIPELDNQNSILLYDAVANEGTQLRSFPAQTMIFASPNAGNFKQVAAHSLFKTVYCPNWELDELRSLSSQLPIPLSDDELSKRYNTFGGSPRLVLGNWNDSLATLKTVITNWNLDYFISPHPRDEWPSRLLKSVYAHTDDVGMKYMYDVFWDYASEFVAKEVYSRYQSLDDNVKAMIERWLSSEPKGAVLLGHIYENDVCSLLLSQKIVSEQLPPSSSLTRQLKYPPPTIPWTPPSIKRVERCTISEISRLVDLTNSEILYKLPTNFPIIDFFNPPNNCFSVGVGRHTIHLPSALTLCKTLQGEYINFIFFTKPGNYQTTTKMQPFSAAHLCGYDDQDQLMLARLTTEHQRVLQRLIQYKATPLDSVAEVNLDCDISAVEQVEVVYLHEEEKDAKKLVT